jgi:anti-sigma B factor antagonist
MDTWKVRGGTEMAENQDFVVAVGAEADGAIVVSVSGDLDLLGATKLHLPLMDAMASSSVVLDLTECGFCDSSGIRTLLQAMRQAESAGRSFRIAGAGKEIVRVLEVTGLLTTLKLYPDVQAAVKG